MYAGEWLRDLYQKFDARERALADQVLMEWVLSDDEGLRFDAEVLTRELKIVTVAPALEQLAIRLQLSRAPSAPSERKRVAMILQELR